MLILLQEKEITRPEYEILPCHCSGKERIAFPENIGYIYRVNNNDILRGDFGMFLPIFFLAFVIIFFNALNLFGSVFDSPKKTRGAKRSFGGFLGGIVRNPVIWIISFLTGFYPLMFVLFMVTLFISDKNRGEEREQKKSRKTTATANRKQSLDELLKGLDKEQAKTESESIFREQVSPTAFGLPSSPRKRRKIVEKFNRKYALNLSGQDIENLVAGSFMSTDWAREICYMNMDYPSVHSWYGTMNPWLKAYLSAFNVLNISSDFSTQEAIVLQSFTQIFSDILGTDRVLTVQEAIRDINYKYLTNFDEATFTIALHFLEEHRQHYKVDYVSVNNSREDIDELLSKYSDANRRTTLR